MTSYARAVHVTRAFGAVHAAELGTEIFRLLCCARQCTGTVLGKRCTLGCRSLSHLAAPADADRPEVPECIATRNRLQQTIAALDLPANFLDELVHQLGGPGIGSGFYVCMLLSMRVINVKPDFWSTWYTGCGSLCCTQMVTHDILLKHLQSSGLTV